MPSAEKVKEHIIDDASIENWRASQENWSSYSAIHDDSALGAQILQLRGGAARRAHKCRRRGPNSEAANLKHMQRSHRYKRPVEEGTADEISEDA